MLTTTIAIPFCPGGDMSTPPKLQRVTRFRDPTCQTTQFHFFFFLSNNLKYDPTVYINFKLGSIRPIYKMLGNSNFA